MGWFTLILTLNKYLLAVNMTLFSEVKVAMGSLVGGTFAKSKSN